MVETKEGHLPPLQRQWTRARLEGIYMMELKEGHLPLFRDKDKDKG